MTKLADASINTLRNSEVDAQPAEDPIFVLTSSQLRQIVTEAVQEAIQPLQDEVAQLREDQARDREEMASLRSKLASLETTQENEISRVCVDIAYDRQRIAKLEKIEPQPMQKDRGEILRALIAANGGKMLAKDARLKMHLSRSRFSELLTIVKDEIEIKPYHLSKRQNVLVLK